MFFYLPLSTVHGEELHQDEGHQSKVKTPWKYIYLDKFNSYIVAINISPKKFNTFKVHLLPQRLMEIK